MLFLKTYQALGGIEVGRTATVVIVAFVAILIAAGCLPEKPPVEMPPVVVAAGDIATCSGTEDDATAKLVGGIDGTVLTLGDEAYPDGSAEDFEECYDPTWGQFKGRTKPTPGNHEYHTEGAEGYFDYFGEAARNPDEGYYSYDLGEWHLIALNSNCGEGEIRCGPGSAQTKWLKEDLAANAADEGRCTLAYMHHPRFTRGKSTAAPLHWSRCGKHSMRRGRMWSFLDTSTTTSASPRRTPRGGQTQSGASGSSLWAAGEVRATTPSSIPFPTVKSTMMRATAC
jgi:Calcineurin-like phosphoesterase